jgi:hypothetical protein
MKLAIIGHAERKFTPKTKQEAFMVITHVIEKYSPSVIISGRSPEGGIDIWAEETADQLKIPKLIFPPEIHQWDGYTVGKIGYKQRNIQIADTADMVAVLVVQTLPPGYKGEPWNRRPCFHCEKHKDRPERHVKSGACWTAWEARALGKQAEWFVI